MVERNMPIESNNDCTSELSLPPSEEKERILAHMYFDFSKDDNLRNTKESFYNVIKKFIRELLQHRIRSLRRRIWLQHFHRFSWKENSEVRSLVDGACQKNLQHLRHVNFVPPQSSVEIDDIDNSNIIHSSDKDNYDSEDTTMVEIVLSENRILVDLSQVATLTFIE